LRDHGYALADFELESSQSQKRKARQDYTFIWQAKPGDPRNVGEARYRIEVEIAGDEVVGFSRSFKLPEDWVRARNSTGIGNIVLTGLLVLLAGGLLAGFVMLFVGVVRHGHIPWAASAKLGVIAGVLTALSGVLQLATSDRSYDTSIPLTTFHAFQAIAIFISALFAGLAVWVLVGLCMSLFPEASDLFKAAARSQWRRDAAIAILLTVAAIAGVSQLEEFLTNRLHAYILADVQIVPDLLDGYVPGLTIFLRSVVYTLVLAAGLGAILYMIRLGWRRRSWWFWSVVVVLLVVLGPAGAHSASEYFAGWVLRFIPLILAVFVIAVFFRNNASAYVAAALCLVLVSPAASLVRQPAGLYRWNGMLLIALMIVAFAWLLGMSKTPLLVRRGARARQP
jgi:hypothetical protein